MNLNNLPTSLLERIVCNVLAMAANRPGELPCFVNGYGPYLARTNPARLLLLPAHTAYALVRAFASPNVRWPIYQPAQHWVLKATCDAYQDGDLQDYLDRYAQKASKEAKAETN